MKTQLLVIGLLLALPVFASERPGSPGNVDGVLITDSTTQSTFSFNEGTWHSCTREDSSLTVHRCSVEGGLISVTDSAGRPSAMPINHARLIISTTMDHRTSYSYIFFGTWEADVNGVHVTSPVRLSFTYYDELNPNQLKGFLRLEEFAITQQLVGRVVD